MLAEHHEVVFEAGFRGTAEIQDDLDDGVQVGEPKQRLPDRQGKDVEELAEFGMT
ncbi:MAG: hypothetical protein ACREM8_08685 [Vulcanimicrobiaceae bacterium]